MRDTATTNTAVSPERTFGYDALYRLKAATGREHASVLVHEEHGGVVWEVGQGMQWREVPAANDTSGTGSLVPYTEAFAYDHAGDLLTTSHTGTVNWTRTQAYAADSNRLAGFGEQSRCNRRRQPRRARVTAPDDAVVDICCLCTQVRGSTALRPILQW